MAGTDELSVLAEQLGDLVTFPDGPVAVALSGGADSAALLWMASQRVPDVVAIHVIHGLPASALMSTAAGQIAALCGVRLSMQVVDPSGTAEHELRQARMEALTEAAGGRHLLFGHTLDDQAETVMYRVLRGTGIDGLAGMAPSTDRIHHPLLGVRREQTRRLAELAGLPFRDDPANDDPGVVRNRLRSELLVLASDIMGRDVRPTLARLADNVRDTPVHPGTLRFETVDDRLRVALGDLRAASDAVAPLRRALASWTDGYPPSRAASNRVMDVVSGQVASTEIEGAIRVYRRNGYLIFDRRETDQTETPPPVTITAGAVQWGEWSFTASRVEGPAVVPLSTWRMLVNEEAGELQVRPGTASDEVTGRRLPDALADARVEATDRIGWPVLTCGGEPVWIPGARRRGFPGHLRGGYLSISASREPAWQTFEP
ncbi:MAG: tRNA lysidine(34) synthetase TilS [Acidimicrobiia bacterium]|nr:tRNA lysidine(34) synthetase TilS [Acidimicrobiia bacterium]